MDNNEQIRAIINEELTKQLEPIKSILEEIKLEIKNLKKNNNVDKVTYFENDLNFENKLQETQNQNEASDAIKKVIKNELSQVSYDTWIAECKGVIEGNILKWFCPNTFTQDVTDKRYAKLILNACKLLELDVKEVKILVGNVEKVI